jgi:ribosomal protein L11 methyltransferase
MASHAAKGGYVILSGLLVEQAEDVLAAYDAHGFTCETREDIGEWSCLTLVKT